MQPTDAGQCNVILKRSKLGKEGNAVRDNSPVPPPRTLLRLVRLKPSPIEIAVIVLINGFLVGQLLFPVGDHDDAHRYPPPGPNPRNDFAAIAGEYYQGAARGRYWRLSLLPDGRYSFIWAGCTGVHCRESGFVHRIGEDLLGLSPIRPIEEPPMERTFRLLKWGPRSYLVPRERFRGFCDGIIQGREPRKEAAGAFYLLGAAEPSSFHGENGPVDGIPELPEPWATYLRDHIVVGTIVEVMEDGRARIDVGSAQGIRVGNILTVPKRGRLRSQQVRAIAVDRDSCEVEEDYHGPFNTPVENRWKLVMARGTEASP